MQKKCKRNHVLLHTEPVAVVIGIHLNIQFSMKWSFFILMLQSLFLFWTRKEKKIDIILFPKYGYLQKKIHHSLIKLLLEEKLLN